MTPPLRQIAVDSNKLVADSADKQMLLNVLRAKDRLPVHFSSLKYVRGNLSISGTAGVSGSLVESGISNTLDDVGDIVDGAKSSGADTFAPSLSVTMASNPSFETAVYDTKEFQSGILKPVSPSLIEYFLQQGWPEDFLTALFVSRVDMRLKTEATDKNGKITTKYKGLYSLENSPLITLRNDFGRFLAIFEMIPSYKKGSITTLLPISSFNNKLSLADIDKLDGKKFDLITGKNFKGQEIVSLVRKSGPSRGISFRARSGSDIEINAGGFEEFLDSKFTAKQINKENTQGIETKYIIKCSDEGAAITVDESDDKSECVVSFDGKDLGKIELDIVFRSPESIIYYLGSYARYVALKKPVYVLTDNSRVMEIKDGKSKKSLLFAKHLNQYFSIERPVYVHNKPNHRGTQAIVIAQQLINLHKSADSLPTTQAIQIVP